MPSCLNASFFSSISLFISESYLLLPPLCVFHQGSVALDVSLSPEDFLPSEDDGEPDDLSFPVFISCSEAGLFAAGAAFVPPPSSFLQIIS